MSDHPEIKRPEAERLYRAHPRRHEQNRFVYPVLSRRSGGISVGVNLNPDKICNFDCIYCQVDRVRQSEIRFVEINALLAELDEMLSLVRSGAIFESEEFQQTPEPLRRLNDIALSGDGEPTTYRNFDEIIAGCADVKGRHGLDDVKMVLITNASMFHRPAVERGLETLVANQGEIWAKLETGTEEYYQQVERTSIPFRQILENITAVARRWPLVIQSLFMRIEGQPPSGEEILAFCGRLNDITAAGGQINLVQIYTVARPPAERFVEALSGAEVDALVETVRRETGLAVAEFYGAGAAS